MPIYSQILHALRRPNPYHSLPEIASRIACSTGERYLSTPLAAEAKAEVGG